VLAEGARGLPFWASVMASPFPGEGHREQAESTSFADLFWHRGGRS
jgi:hypothetical protein